jgi:hypothetical protein
MKSLKVDIKQTNIKYEIFFSSDILVSIKDNIKDYEKKRFLFVIDSKVYDLYFKENPPVINDIPLDKGDLVLVLPN